MKIYLKWKTDTAWFFILMIILIMSGCAGIGAPTVARDRFNYVKAISKSWKEQMLLNLVKVRYADAPVFMDITSVINQYAVESEFSLGTTLDMRNTQTFGGRAKYTDRPTITYAPLIGEKFTRSLLTPIPVPGILFLLQSGYAADFVLRTTVQTINGLDNRFGGSLSSRSADRGFHQLIKALRRIQLAGGMGMRIKAHGDKKAVMIIFRSLTDKAIAADTQKVGKLLGLNSNTREFRVSYGSYAADDQEIAILSRSMLQIIVDFASYIDVPEEDVAEGRVYASLRENEKTEADLPPLVQIRSGLASPDDAYVAIPYRDHWFWIDDRDYPSKRMFTFLMFLFSLTETGGSVAAPIVTIPAS